MAAQCPPGDLGSTYPLRGDWLFTVARELQLLAGELIGVTIPQRAEMIRIALTRLPAPETYLEKWFLSQFAKDAARAHRTAAPPTGMRTASQSGAGASMAREVAALLRTQYVERWTLRRVAEITGRHPSTIEREMKRSFGMGLHAYLAQCRMHEAMQLLAGTDLKIESVGREVGYSGKKNFYEAFRRATGLTPLQYRLRSRLSHAS
jgi:AraC-like DNA-binding protein